MTPRTLILRTAGTNCDAELAHAFALAGADPRVIHLNELIDEPARLDDFDLLGFPGGFSYGDDIAAGRILANRLRHRLIQPLQRAVERGVPMIGICNGFQVLVKLGLLPDPRRPSLQQTVTLADNTGGRFIDRWVQLQADPTTVCIWTRGLSQLDLPIAHGEGRFHPGPDENLRTLQQNKQIALRYAPHDNPNGSADDIAGICDPSGLVFGLMPHPERFTDPTHHPCWTRTPASSRSIPAGLRFFHNAVEYVKENATTRAAS